MILFLLFINSAMADVGFGASGAPGRYSFAVGDTNHFSQTPDDDMGLYRYGNGSGKLNVGNGIGLELRSYGGLFLLNPASPIQLGLDFGNGIIRADTNDRSFYVWAPGFSVGPQGTVGSFRMFLGVTGGGYLGNVSRTDLLPDMRLSHGFTFHANSNLINFGLNYKTFNSEHLYDVDVYVNVGKYSIGVNVEQLRETRAGIIIRSEL